MIELPILLKRRFRQFPITSSQLPIQRPHQLHSANLAQEVRRWLIDALVAGSETDAEVARGQLRVPGLGKPVGRAKEPGLRRGERGFEKLDAF
jgi:hypothetical protein